MYGLGVGGTVGEVCGYHVGSREIRGISHRSLFCGVETMPVEWDGDRQKVRARARRRMGLWAIVSMCMVCLFLYLKVITHRQV